MSPPERDVTDYVEDTAQHEDATLFLPAGDHGVDRWSFLYGGILMGLAGGILPTVAPWLAGVLIAAGYGMTAMSMIAPSHRFARALRLGFVLTAFLGAVIVAGEIAAPDATTRIIDMAARRSLVFPAVGLMPLVIGILRYVYVVAMGIKR